MRPERSGPAAGFQRRAIAARSPRPVVKREAMPTATLTQHLNIARKLPPSPELSHPGLQLCRVVYTLAVLVTSLASFLRHTDRHVLHVTAFADPASSTTTGGSVSLATRPPRSGQSNPHSDRNVYCSDRMCTTLGFRRPGISGGFYIQPPPFTLARSPSCACARELLPRVSVDAEQCARASWRP